MLNWESLIALRSRPAKTICKTEDSRKNNALMRSKMWHLRHPTYNADYYAEHREEKLAQNAKWKKEHKDKNREHSRKYREKHKNDPEWKEKRRIWNKVYRAKKKEKKESA